MRKDKARPLVTTSVLALSFLTHHPIPDIGGIAPFMSALRRQNYTVTKNDTDVAHYNLNAHQLILVFLAETLLREYAIEW